jgi:hypothetical protein
MTVITHRVDVLKHRSFEYVSAPLIKKHSQNMPHHNATSYPKIGHHSNDSRRNIRNPTVFKITPARTVSAWLIKPELYASAMPGVPMGMTME